MLPRFILETLGIFFEKCFAGKELVVRTTPYNESSVTDVYDLTGLYEHSHILYEACGMSQPLL